jgi:hypothetical protein
MTIPLAPVTMYGLPASVQVLFDKISPPTSVANSGVPHKKNNVANVILKTDFFITRSSYKMVFRTKYVFFPL